MELAKVEAAADHLRYEVQMLTQSAELLVADGPERPPPGRARVRYTTALESFLIHSRLLNEFLCGSVRRDDDLRARHFMDEGWSEGPPRDLTDDFDTINKRVAHLTTTRVETEPDWPRLQELGDSVVVRLERFLEAVADQHPERRPWLDDAAHWVSKWRAAFAEEGLADVDISTASEGAPSRPISLTSWIRGRTTDRARRGV